MLAWLVLFRLLGGRADAEDTPVAAPFEPSRWLRYEMLYPEEVIVHTVVVTTTSAMPS